MKDTYYIQVKGNEFTPVEGTKVMIKDIECFAHKVEKYWNITEAKSGMVVVQNYRLKEDAIERAEKLISKNYEWLKNMVAEMESQGKVSPKFA